MLEITRFDPLDAGRFPTHGGGGGLSGRDRVGPRAAAGARTAACQAAPHPTGGARNALCISHVSGWDRGADSHAKRVTTCHTARPVCPKMAHRRPNLKKSRLRPVCLQVTYTTSRQPTAPRQCEKISPRRGSRANTRGRPPPVAAAGRETAALRNKVSVSESERAAALGGRRRWAGQDTWSRPGGRSRGGGGERRPSIM